MVIYRPIVFSKYTSITPYTVVQWQLHQHRGPPADGCAMDADAKYILHKYIYI